MPISFSALQIYDAYLTTYRNKRYTSHDIHDDGKLRHIYRSIQLKRNSSPLYLTPPTANEIENAITLKEKTIDLQSSLTSLNGFEEGSLFMQKSISNTSPEFADISYMPLAPHNDVPESIELKVYNCATPQINNSSFLPSNQKVLIPAGSYSFDILSNQLHYEIGISISADDTHENIQKELINTINNSNMGIKGQIIYDENNRSAIQLTSKQIGVANQNPYPFVLIESYSESNANLLQYLGLNKEIHPAKNLKYELDGKEYTSYSNEIDAYGTYHISLNKDTIGSALKDLHKLNSQIGANSNNEHIDLIFSINPDADSIKNNISQFTDNFNHFMNDINDNLRTDIHKMLISQQNDLVKYGISVNDNSSLTFNSDAISQEEIDSSYLDSLQHFGSSILKKLNTISLDPLNYANRRICTYANPSINKENKIINPYTTSSYAGILFNSYV